MKRNKKWLRLWIVNNNFSSPQRFFVIANKWRWIWEIKRVVKKSERRSSSFDSSKKPISAWQRSWRCVASVQTRRENLRRAFENGLALRARYLQRARELATRLIVKLRHQFVLAKIKKKKKTRTPPRTIFIGLAPCGTFFILLCGGFFSQSPPLWLAEFQRRIFIDARTIDNSKSFATAFRGAIALQEANICSTGCISR